MDPNENKPFDYRMILAFVLMFAIVMIYTMYMQPPPQETGEPATTTEQPPDTGVRDYQEPAREQPSASLQQREEPDTVVFVDVCYT